MAKKRPRKPRTADNFAGPEGAVEVPYVPWVSGVTDLPRVADWPAVPDVDDQIYEALSAPSVDERLDRIEEILRVIVKSLEPNTVRPWQAHANRKEALKLMNGEDS